MADTLSKLAFAWRARQGDGSRTHRVYLDFVVDGQSLSDRLKVGDYIGCFGWTRPEAEQGFLDALLLKRASALGANRCPIYICPECGDIACGALTVQIEKSAEYFIWRNFGFENNYDESMRDLERYKHVGPFRFRQTEYWHTLIQRPRTS